jgi:AraC-like DNA-binding protein
MGNKQPMRSTRVYPQLAARYKLPRMFNPRAAILRIGSKIGLPIGVIRVHQRLSTSSGAPFSRPTAPFRAKCLWKEEWRRAVVPASSRLSSNLPKPVGWMRVPSVSCTLHRNGGGHYTRLPQKPAVPEPSSRNDSALWPARELLSIRPRGARTSPRVCCLNETGNIGTVASRVGYRSEAAFSIAFKRWAGISRSGYRNRTPLIWGGRTQLVR